MYSLDEQVFFVKSYYSKQKNLKEVLHLYREQFNVPRHKWPSKSVIITYLPNICEFISRRVFNEEPASKENHSMGGA